MPAYGTQPIYSVSPQDPGPVQIMTTADSVGTLPFTTAPVAITPDYSGLYGFSMQVKFASAPSAGTIVQCQISNDEVTGNYVTVNTFTFSGTESVQRFDGAGFMARFVRANMTVNAGGQLCTIEVGR
jgi:hypothetical protein